MSYFKKIEACDKCISELYRSLTEQAVATLREECRNMGAAGWMKWLEKNDGDIVQFMTATPECRNTLPEWQKSGVRAKLTLAAIYRCRLGQHLMQSIDEIDLRPDREDVIYGSWICAKRIISNDIPLWEFPEPNPFTGSGG